MKTRHDAIVAAVAQGWTTDKNKSKEMDVALAMAIVANVERVLALDQQPQLGCATTRELLAELSARVEISGNLDYRTIDS